jgi:hypothetical protein
MVAGDGEGSSNMITSKLDGMVASGWVLWVVVDDW